MKDRRRRYHQADVAHPENMAAEVRRNHAVPSSVLFGFSAQFAEQRLVSMRRQTVIAVNRSDTEHTVRVGKQRINAGSDESNPRSGRRRCDHLPDQIGIPDQVGRGPPQHQGKSRAGAGQDQRGDQGKWAKRTGEAAGEKQDYGQHRRRDIPSDVHSCAPVKAQHGDETDRGSNYRQFNCGSPERRLRGHCVDAIGGHDGQR